MSGLVHDLYSAHSYPALSHPATHPAVLAVAARAGGVKEVADPAACRVLELGCASGHNLLPVAAAYPASHFTGIDFSEAAIARAREAATAAGLENIHFEVADILEWQPQQTFDYIVAHGVFSWVADEVKERLLELCSALLTPSGVACIGYNTLPGWSLRRDAAPLIRALAAQPGSPLGADPAGVVQELARLSGRGGSPYARHLAEVLDHMQRKGRAILGFDDFAPVCDPVYFSQFVSWAGSRGLRYIGESILADNLPPGGSVHPEAMGTLAEFLGADPMMLAQTQDLLSGRTHRSSLLCRDDAPAERGLSTAIVMDFHVSARGEELPIAPTAAASQFRAALGFAAPLPLSPRDFLATLPDPSPHDARDIAAWVFQAARLGALSLRHGALDYPTAAPERPRLSALNLHFARHALPVVDAWHVSCHFPAGHDRLLARMDGSIGLAELHAIARADHPELDFPRWMDHLAGRGLLV